MKRIIPFLLALLVGAGSFFALRSVGAHREGAKNALSGREPRTGALELYTPLTEEKASAPEALALETEEDSAGEYGRYGKIVAQEDGLTIYSVQAKRYRGLLAEITDVSRLTVGTCGAFSEWGAGKQVGEIAHDAGAILAVNGGAFYDPDGNGLGGCPTGNVIKDGQVLWGGYEETIGLDADGKLHCGLFNIDDCRERNLVWALSYTPTLIIEGEVQSVKNHLSEPRTAVGQREDGAVLLFCIQGRQASALGVTEQELAYIMQDLGCVNAGNLDGGASSYMVYHDEYINIANTGGRPRPIPTCLMFMPKEG